MVYSRREKHFCRARTGSAFTTTEVAQAVADTVLESSELILVQRGRGAVKGGQHYACTDGRQNLGEAVPAHSFVRTDVVPGARDVAVSLCGLGPHIPALVQVGAHCVLRGSEEALLVAVGLLV